MTGALCEYASDLDGRLCSKPAGHEDPRHACTRFPPGYVPPAPVSLEQLAEMPRDPGEPAMALEADTAVAFEERPIEEAPEPVEAPPVAAAQEFSLYGHDLFGEPVKQAKKAGALSLRFEFPPFSVLNAREGAWQDRKREWISLGIQSELGRGLGAGNNLTMSETIQREKPSADQTLKNAKAATAVSQKLAPGGGGGGAWLGGPKTSSTDNFKRSNAPGGSPRPAMDYSKNERGAGNGQPLEQATEGEEVASGTSIFDPVLAELSYRWFCPTGGQIVDPFAGGSVRGIVAGCLGFKYHGIDLRAEQIAANEAQRASIAPSSNVAWACGDSLELLKAAPAADLIFSCPPYGDLERYSDDPADLSTMDYPEFLRVYRAIISQAALALKPNRMACFVVGDFRDKKTGNYRGFVADTILAFRDVGLELYNDAVLVTAVGSLPIRVSGQFPSGRKLGKTHQNVLCFAKGDPRKAFV